MADKDQSDDTTIAATETSSDDPPVTAAPAVATSTTVIAGPTLATMRATTSASSSIPNLSARRRRRRRFQDDDDSSSSSSQSLEDGEKKVMIVNVTPGLDIVSYTQKSERGKRYFEVKFPLPDEENIVRPYLYNGRVCFLKETNMNGYRFQVFCDAAEGREDLSLPLFLGILSQGIKPEIHEVSRTITVRVSSWNGEKCFIQGKPLYADMITYILYSKAMKGEINAQPVTKPIPRKIYVYIDHAASRYYRVMVHEEESASEDTPSTISVKCVDYGEIIKAERSKIFSLDDYPELASNPHQAFEVVVSSVFEDTENISESLEFLYGRRQYVEMITVSVAPDGTPTVELGYFSE